MTAELARLAKRAALLAAAAATAIAGGALALTVATAPLELGLAYPPPTGRLQDAAAIFVNNGRVGLLIVGATLLAPTLGRGARVLSVVLAVVLAGNLVLIAAVIASDGARAVHALWAHLSCEIAAYSLAIAVYQHTRTHGPPRRPASAAVAAAVLALLALGAVLEVTPL